jgi:hypothetical protein
MVKKIGLITLFVLFAGVIIYGAVNRTAAKSETAGRTESQNVAANGRHAAGNENQSLGGKASFGQQNGQGYQGQGNQGQDSEGQGNQGQGSQDQGSQGQGSQGQGNQGQGSQGQGNQGQGGGNGSGKGRNQQLDAPAIPELSSVSGVVIQAPAAGFDLILETDGGAVLIGTGPGYLADQGFVILAGDSIRADGTWEGDEFKAATITLTADGRSITLRDEWGRPMWSGAGRNAQNRQSGQNSG